MKIYAIALNTYREAIRNKIIYSVLLFAVLLVGASALFGRITLGSTAQVIKNFGLFSLSFFGVVITIVLGVSLLNKEIKYKTIYNILSKPVSRGEFILGKFLGLAVTVGLLVSVMGAGLIGFASLYEQNFDLNLLYAVGFTILEIGIVAAVTIFFSSVVVTTTLTGIFTLATYIAGRSISYFQYFLNSNTEHYDPALAQIIKVLDWILPDLNVFNVADAVVAGQVIETNHVLYALGYAVSYCTVALVAAIFVFRNRELI